MKVFCTECGAPLEEDARFCEECGAQVDRRGTANTPVLGGPPLQAARAQTVEVQPLHPLPAATTTQRHIIVTGELKSTGLGIILSFLWTGLGQLYAGSIARGLIMMMLTPLVWIIGWFGGFAAFVGGLASVVPTTPDPDRAAAAGLGFFGFLMAVTPIIWWIWGMVDAKNLCEAFNRRGSMRLTPSS